MPVAFPSIKPSSRRYSPGNYPQQEFRALNGATTVIRYGSRRVDAEMELGFNNITDDQASAILDNYQQVNRSWDYVTFSSGNAAVGAGANLALYFREMNGSGLRWRYADAPQVQSVKPGRSSVTCRFVAVLDAP